MGTAFIPGTGLSYRQHFGSGKQSSPENGTALPPENHGSRHIYVNTAPIEEIHSASTELLTSATLKEVKQFIQTAHQQHLEISGELDIARPAKEKAEKRFYSWDRGFLFKKLFKGAFAKRQEARETETAKVSELEEQLRLSTIATHIEIEQEQADLYYRLRDEFAALCECAAIWDIKTRQATDMFHERTTAQSKLSRESIKFTLDACDLIEWDQKVPSLKNAKGGDLFLYPGFILYRAAREAFSLIEYHDVKGLATNISFIEEEKIPADSRVVGQSWAKGNRDGSRDRRFASNHEIPIAEYGSLALKSDNGLWEEFQFSNLQKMINFSQALKKFTSSFNRIAA